jgi:hypothetical protein
MQKHFELTDIEFEKEFSESTLDPSMFTHQAHIRLAWIHIEKYGVEIAVKNIKAQIKKYVKHLNAEDKYNETVTVAGVRAINHFMLRSESRNFADFIKENDELLDNFKGLLLTHYETNIFESEMAKQVYIEPEIQSFD